MNTRHFPISLIGIRSSKLTKVSLTKLCLKLQNLPVALRNEALEVPVHQRRCVKPALQKWIKTYEESFMSPRLPFGWLFVPNLCKTTLRWQVLLVIVNILKLVKQHVCGRDLGYQKTLVKPKVVCQLICKTLQIAKLKGFHMFQLECFPSISDKGPNMNSWRLKKKGPAGQTPSDSRRSSSHTRATDGDIIHFCPS